MGVSQSGAVDKLGRNDDTRHDIITGVDCYPANQREMGYYSGRVEKTAL